MRPCGEKLGNTGSLESLFDKAESGSKASSSGTNDDSVEGVINDGIVFEELVLEFDEKVLQNLSRETGLQGC